MAALTDGLIEGEYRRVYDDRYRIVLPAEFIGPLGGEESECVLSKEREGCLSLWKLSTYEQKIERGLKVFKTRFEGDLLDRDFSKVQRFSRLLSTRSRRVKLAQRGRLLVPEGFREFLGVQPDSETLVVGAGVCVEIWNPARWFDYLRADLGEFTNLFKELAN